MDYIEISQEQYLEVEKLSLGVFSPLSGFMNEDQFYSCVEHLRLLDGSLFTIPIFFDVDNFRIQFFAIGKKIKLIFAGEHVANLVTSSIFRPNKERVCKKVFGTSDINHPGVINYYSMGDFFVGGDVELLKRPRFTFSSFEFTPTETKEYFKKMKWKTIVGFQTRNVPHTAHEYLQKLALEYVDGIFIQPLVGKKKTGDFTPEAIILGYTALIENYFPTEKVKFGVLSTLMRYAGPREAIFHAIIRRNYGCTHFVIGRDHAGVGNFYGEYEGHELALQYQEELGIQILCLKGPYYCTICKGVVTSRICPHKLKRANECFDISGTMIRSQLMESINIDQRILRPEVANALRGVDLFVN